LEGSDSAWPAAICLGLPAARRTG